MYQRIRSVTVFAHISMIKKIKGELIHTYNNYIHIRQLQSICAARWFQSERERGRGAIQHSTTNYTAPLQQTPQEVGVA